MGLYLNYLTLLVAVSNLLLGLLVISKGTTNKVNIFFGVSSIITACWVLSNFLFYLLPNNLFVVKTTYSLGALVVPSAVVWSYYLINKTFKSKLVYLVLILGLFLSLFVFIDGFVIKNLIANDYGQDHIQTGKYFLFYNALLFLPLTLLFYSLFKGYKNGNSIVRSQLAYLIVGALSLAIVSIGMNVILPLFNYTIVAPIDAQSSIFFVAFSAYSIIRFRLFDIRIFIRRAFVIGGALTSSLIISLGIFYLNNNIFNAIIPDVVIFPIALFAGIILFFWFQKWFLKFANKYFFTTLYDRQQVTEELAAKMNQTLNLNELLIIISTKLTQVFGVEQYVFASCDNSQKNACYIEQNSVINIKSVHRILSESNILNYLEKTTDIIVRDEIIPFIEEEALKPKKTDEHIRKALLKLKENLSDAEIAVCVPIVSNNKLISLLLLGDKLSKDAYTVQDIRLLETVSDQAAVAIQNARLYRASQEFNLKLKAEVEKATMDLRVANEKLRELDSAKSEFMSIASHQLRTPLAGIVGYLSMLEEGDYGKLDDGQSKVVKELYDASQRLVRLVNTFLNVTRIEAGRLTMNFTEVNLVEHVAAEVRELIPTATKKSVTLVLTEPKQSVITAMADSDKIRDVFLNLIDNAIKYTPEGSVTVAIEQPDDKTAHFTVHDTGVGIDPKDAASIFQKFVRGSGIARVQPNGSGLGLFIVKKIVEAHHGKVWMESDGPNKGSTFHVILPLQQPAEHIGAAAESTGKEEKVQTEIQISSSNDANTAITIDDKTAGKTTDQRMLYS